MLITKTDILEFWPLSLNIDDARINPSIIRAEQNNLTAILGPELYFALSEAVIVPGDRFDKLLDGEPYTSGSNFPRQWVGVKQLLCSYAFAYFSANNPLHVTRGGVNKKGGEDTENAPTREVNYLSQQAYSESIRLEGEFKTWIYSPGVQNIYPEYGGGDAPAKNASFNFWNGSRNIRYGLGPNYWEYKNPLK